MKKSEEDYEGEMAKNTLKKLIVFSTELLPMIKDEQQMPAWLQDKFSKLDYYINTVYSYMKFSEINSEKPEPEEVEEENETEEEVEEFNEMQLEVKLDNVVKK